MTARATNTTMIYLDHNATTPPLPEVVEEIARVSRDAFGNPGSRHAPGRAARRVLETCRESLAALLGALPEDLFTSGGTEANNLALLGATAGPPARLATTAGEHPSVWEPCRYRRGQGWGWDELQVDGEGVLLVEQSADLPWGDLRFAGVILAHNETGVIQDISGLSDRCREHGVPLHLDAVQGVGRIPVDFHSLGAATLSLAAHKFYGPRGVGALLIRRGYRLSPLLHGGHQESERRPGTELVALVAGMTRALELFHRDREARTKHLRSLRDRLQFGLVTQCAPTVVNSAKAARLPNTLNIAFPGLDGEALLVALDLEGICCSLGSTCASGSAEPAPALVAMGCSPEVLRSSVRFSLGMGNSLTEIDDAISRIVRVVAQMRATVG